MPLCPKCDIAYLDGETHTCPPRRTARSRAFLAAYVVGGAVLGTLVVTVLVAAYALARGLRGEYSLLVGQYLGALPGGWIGWIVGARRLPKTFRE